MVMLRSALRLQESCGEGAVQGQNSEAAHFASTCLANMSSPLLLEPHLPQAAEGYRVKWG